jgi:hypothetical protein
MEQEKWAAAINSGNRVGRWGGAADSRVDVAKIDVVGIGIEQKVETEHALVALLPKPVPEAAHHYHDRVLDVPRQDRGIYVIAAPTALVRGSLGEAGDVGHGWADQRATMGGAAFHRTEHVVERFTTLTTFFEILGAYLSRSFLRRMKNVVRPESP